MRRVKISSLRPGMKLAYNIYNSRDEELLAAGVVLTGTYIKKLAGQDLSYVWVDDGVQSGAPVSVKDVVAQETRIAAIRQVKNILLETKESGRLVIEPQSLYFTVSDFTDQLLSKDDLLFNMVDLRLQDDYTFAHSVNVCILALMTGITLGYSRGELAVLGMGALLHDLGKIKVPDEILIKPGSLTEKEWVMMKRHTVEGYWLIHDAGNIGELQAIIALQHHENYDGSGYPLGLKGDKIHEYAQVVAIADKFDAITADRVYRKAFPPHEAYEMCSASGNYFFKEHIAKAFMYNIAAYPAGTIVELNNGMVAVSVDTQKGYSLFPRVRVLYDENHRPAPDQFELPLFKKPELSVVKVLKR
ncbi:MAG: Cyclic di-GMP phosphodiesterase response regulator RpfG [Pelotomaculum sp. PtaU1.Bin035]|nr:MAG: Cyclic di-GMP phosphodiesterase response regulator RpfG [Pelotomaculum sp. PtaU1.Bin035]